MSSHGFMQPEFEIPDERLQQFGLIHLIGLTTLFALVSALLAPLLRATEGSQVFDVLLVVCLEGVVVCSTFVLSTWQREKVLAVAGRRIGQSNMGRERTRSFGQCMTAGAFLFLAVLQLGFAIASFLSPSSGVPWILLFSQIVLGFCGTKAFLQMLWGRDLGSVEFFENGIVKSASRFTPWEKLTVRPNKQCDYAVNLRLVPPNWNILGTRTTVFVDLRLKVCLLKYYSNNGKCSSGDVEAR